MKRFQFYGDSNVTLISPLKCTVNIYTMEREHFIVQHVKTALSHLFNA